MTIIINFFILHIIYNKILNSIIKSLILRKKYCLQSQHQIKQMLEIKTSQYKKTKDLFQQSQKQYVKHLQSLLPFGFIEIDDRHQQSQNLSQNYSLDKLDIFNQKSMKSFNKFNDSLRKSKISQMNSRKVGLNMGQFIRNLVRKMSQLKIIEQNGELEGITKEFGIDIKQVNRLENQECKIKYMLSSIDRSIEEHKKRMGNQKNYNMASIHNGTQLNKNSLKSNLNCNDIQKQKKKSSLIISNEKDGIKGNQNELQQKTGSRYQQFIKLQNKKDVDTFAWLQINTKYSMLQKKLKSKLIQSINQTKNQNKIRQLIQIKQNSKKLDQNSFTRPQSLNTTFHKQKYNFNKSKPYDIQDQKVDLTNESLFMQQFQKAKIQYNWTDGDQKMFSNSIKSLKKKCSNNSQFLKLCGRFKFISQGEFQTLSYQQISRNLNKNNKIYLSRQFLLDKYFSSTQILTEQQMRFILKTSPMLSRCVDRNFIKTAIKNIKYENISDLQLKIAQDIIGKFQKLRNSVRMSRKIFKQQANKVTKQRIAFFQRKRQIQMARQIAQEQLKKHKTHLIRALNYNKKNENNEIVFKGLEKKCTSNIWKGLNKFHPSTGLFVKDCNEQCTDDIFNVYQKQYLGSIQANSKNQKPILLRKAQMIRFYTGGPDQLISLNFNVGQSDIKNICQLIKAYFFQKKMISVLQFIEISSSSTNRQQTKLKTTLDLKTKKNLGFSYDEQLQQIAKRKLIENRQKAKQSVYVNKLLFLAAQNSYQSLKALNPQYTSEQINTKDKKGNSALYYACKYNNEEFVDFLLKFGANPNIKCQNGTTPLHESFKSNNLLLILRILSNSWMEVDLNSVNNELKTPLAYCSREILQRLNLQQGKAWVENEKDIEFLNNNSLLKRGQFDKLKQEVLELKEELSRKVSRTGMKNGQNKNETLSSIKSMRD